MSSETIAFLKLMRQGHNPAELFKKAAGAKLEKAAAQERVVKEILSQSQAAVEEQAAPLIKQMAALDVTGPGKEHLQADKQKVERLQAVQLGLKHALDDKQEALRAKTQDTAKLRSDLQDLTTKVRQVPPAGCPAVLIEIGDAATTYMSHP